MPDVTASTDAEARTALVAGVGRSIGIGSAVARGLVDDGWTVVTAGHRAYDAKMSWGADPGDTPRPGSLHIEADLADPDAAAELGITANVINPGGTDTGWMTPEIVDDCLRRNLQPRVGLPEDCANLVRFLCSPQGGWINAQLLYSDGGLTPR